MIVKAGKHFLKKVIPAVVICILLIGPFFYWAGVTDIKVLLICMAFEIIGICGILLFIFFTFRRALYDTNRDSIVCWDYRTREILKGVPLKVKKEVKEFLAHMEDDKKSEGKNER